jgi:prepilin-type N-terminal cleavage/methylation domain-containing protein/prepilin-type processing-associated H-X9-DG protein
MIKQHKCPINMRRDKQDGFTLIEMLVVIAIIVIIAALLLPTLSLVRRKGQQIQCVNNLHQLGVGLQVVLANEHGYPLFKGGRYESYIDQLEMEGLGVNHPRGTNGAFDPKTDFYERGVWRCPSTRRPISVWPAPERGSYGYNAYGVLFVENPTNTQGFLGHWNQSSGIYIAISESEVVNPSAMMALGDSFDGSMAFSRDESAIVASGYSELTRHRGKANAVFCDGHVESPTLQFLFEDTSDEALSRWNHDHQPHRELLHP